MEYGWQIFSVLVFPGLIFTAVAGLITSWIDRKVTARVQMRTGPPILQPFYDVVKLFIKETCVPVGGSKALFLSAPIIGLAGVALASTIICRSFVGAGVQGDLIVVLYLLTMPAMAVVLGSYASRNPLASLGGSREMKLVMSYELPFILAAFVPVIQLMQTNAPTIRLADLAANAPLALPSGIIALLVSILCMQAKLTLIPFDMPEAETELTGGAYIEYSGPPLALFKLTRVMMLFTMPMFLVAVFCGGMIFKELSTPAGILHAVLGILKYVGLVVLVVLIRNTAPRVRIDQAVRFFWGPMTFLALLAAVLAFRGL